jgi:hypothetical protein
LSHDLDAERCALVNLAISPASYVDLSVDGSLVVAMAVDAQANVTVFAFDAQTGRARWSRSVACWGASSRSMA